MLLSSIVQVYTYTVFPSVFNISIVDATSFEVTVDLAKANRAAWESVKILTFVSSDCLISTDHFVRKTPSLTRTDPDYALQ